MTEQTTRTGGAETNPATGERPRRDGGLDAPGSSERLQAGEQAEVDDDARPGGRPRVRRQVDIDASPEEVFEALITEQGRDRWMDEPDREIHIESAEAPHRLVWWWAGDEEPATRVDFRIVALPRGTRVIVTESAPSFPLLSLAASFELVAA